MRALVTGVAGFVGSTLARRLLADGHDVVGVDALTDYYDPRLKRENLRDIDHPRLRVVEADLNAVDLAALLADVEVVYHQAGQPGVRKSWGADFDDYLHGNVGATQKLLEAALRAPQLARFVYASSSSVYGNALRYPTEETDRPQPLSPYGVTKLAAEHLCVLYAQNYGLPTVSLRYFTVYGPRQRPDMAFTRFCTSVRDGDEIPVFGTGQQVRDFTYVDDVVAANLRVATADVPAGAVFNVAGGTSTTVNEVIELLGEISGRTPAVRRGDPVPGDVERTGGSTAAIEAATGWAPTVPLREGLAEQYRWAASVLT
ncbi:NAD-dependent epimerase/dehydratase family protein [Pseudonocardia cypriaca]|uniref:Nucleoside-diphosphate-sugar epimerase n=1 Tax=Pseudonocardia cypriaca TaxID=882449 RepID=A0A543GAL8_9PSEU|nr:NAD-dependent epimerase/dehydratase family protein [Pseudonocardia cypriaca]TQM43118.1 nucleoside-diphosphate-sugar epimerase [Pseudonocardia cypriaca]